MFIVGANDLTADLQLPTKMSKGRAPLLTALSTVVLAARAHGVAVVDAVFNDIRDESGFEEEARQGREYGFDGKCCIYPSQVDMANKVFTPSEAEIKRARQIIRVVEAAEGGVALLDGAIVEDLHRRQAERILSRAGESRTVPPGMQAQ